jgi:hypothetical protein
MYEISRETSDLSKPNNPANELHAEVPVLAGLNSD